jgi:hypothetical protein
MSAVAKEDLDAIRPACAAARRDACLRACGSTHRQAAGRQDPLALLASWR